MNFKGNIAVFMQRNETRFVNRLKKISREGWEKSATTVTNVFDREYYDSLCNELQQDLSIGWKKFPGKAEKKRNKCNKCILKGILWFFVQRTETSFVQRCLKISGKAEKKVQQV